MRGLSLEDRARGGASVVAGTASSKRVGGRARARPCAGARRGVARIASGDSAPLSGAESPFMPWARHRPRPGRGAAARVGRLGPRDGVSALRRRPCSSGRRGR